MVVCPWIFLYLLGFLFIFCHSFNAGFPDFRLPRAAEQGGAPRLPAEEAAAAGACAPAPANGASPGLERMLTEMQIDVPLGGEGQRKTDWERKSGAWGGGGEGVSVAWQWGNS